MSINEISNRYDISNVRYFDISTLNDTFDTDIDGGNIKSIRYIENSIF